MKLFDVMNYNFEKQDNNALKFYKIMAIPVLLYGCEIWTLKKRDWNRIQAAEIKFFRTVKGCTKIN
jgi:hypothetical protein